MHKTSIVGEGLTHTNLCGSCFAASNTTEACALQTALQIGCRYCGGEPYCGTGHYFDANGAPVGLRFVCKKCADEYFRYLRQRMPGFGDPDLSSEQIAEMARHDITAFLAEADAHMRKWVMERSS